MNQNRNKPSYLQIVSLRNRIKAYRQQLYKNNPDLPTEPSMLYRFSMNFPELYRLWRGHLVEHGDFYRVNRLLENLVEVKTIISTYPSDNHEEICKACLLLDEACDQLAFLVLNQSSGLPWKEGNGKHYETLKDDDLPKFYRSFHKGLLRCRTRILDSACQIQEDFEDQFPEIFERIWNHHVPVTEEQAQQVIDGVIDPEELLEETDQFFQDQYKEEMLDEDEEDDFDEVLYVTTFDLASLLDKLG